MASLPSPPPSPSNYKKHRRSDSFALIQSIIKEREKEEHQEEVATLNSLVDHYKKEAQEASALCQEYEAKYLAANAKLIQQQELIVKLTHQGVE